VGFGPSRVAALSYGLLILSAAGAALLVSNWWIRIPAFAVLIYSLLCFVAMSSWAVLLPERKREGGADEPR
jgi:hypothetical protein